MNGYHIAGLAGFYVDVRDGEVVAPAEAVSEDEAETVLAIFGDVILAVADAFKGFDFVAGFADSEPEARKVQAALKARDGDRLRELFEQARGRHGTGEPAPEANRVVTVGGPGQHACLRVARMNHPGVSGDSSP